MNKLFPEEKSHSGENPNSEMKGDKEYASGSSDANRNELLNTIKVPQNLAQLTKRLPKSNYSIK